MGSLGWTGTRPARQTSPPPHHLEANEGLVALTRPCTSSVAHTKCVIILNMRILQVFWSKLWSIVGID